MSIVFNSDKKSGYWKYNKIQSKLAEQDMALSGLKKRQDRFFPIFGLMNTRLHGLPKTWPDFPHPLGQNRRTDYFLRKKIELLHTNFLHKSL